MGGPRDDSPIRRHPGTAEDVAEVITKMATRRGFSPRLAAMDDYDRYLVYLFIVPNKPPTFGTETVQDEPADGRACRFRGLDYWGLRSAR